MNQSGPADTIAFAEKVFAILNEGAKSATYKYAVLMGLLELCCEKHDEHGIPPESVTTEQLARKVMELYWPQTKPYGRAGKPLCQFTDKNKQAKIIRLIERARHTHAEAETLWRFEHTNRKAFQRLLRDVEQKLAEDPLPRLQNVQGLSERFIYEIDWPVMVKPKEFRAGSNLIRFIGNAEHHLVRLRGLLRPLLEQEWTRWVRDNTGIENQLGAYLFPENRAALVKLRDPLVELQQGLCFYCQGPLHRNSEVDHFLPWARTHNDNLGNLVAAHKKCNGFKSAYWAASTHLEKWVNRLENQRLTLEQIAHHTFWPFDPGASLGRARGTYLHLPRGVRLWVSQKQFEELNSARIHTALQLAS